MVGMTRSRVNSPKRRWLRLSLMSIASYMLMGCASGTSVCDHTSWSYAIVNGIPVVGTGVGATCLGSDIVSDAGRAISGINKSREEAAMAKTFRSSPSVESDITNTPGTLDYVMTVQEKYRAADYGIATEAEKSSLTGRYSLGNKVFVIHDTEKYWLVAYDGEPATVKK